MKPELPTKFSVQAFVNHVFTYAEQTKIQNRSPTTGQADYRYCALGTFIRKQMGLSEREFLNAVGAKPKSIVEEANCSAAISYRELADLVTGAPIKHLELMTELHSTEFKTYGQLQRWLTDHGYARCSYMLQWSKQGSKFKPCYDQTRAFNAAAIYSSKKNPKLLELKARLESVWPCTAYRIKKVPYVEVPEGY